MSVVIRGGLVVTAEEGAIPAQADVLIEGNRIAAVAPGIEALGADVIDASGALVMPGLVDTHTHSWQYAFRGGLVRGHGFLDYVKKFSLYRNCFTPQDSYDAVRGCSVAQLNAGVTSVLDFVHGANSTAAHVEAMFEAHASVGQRTVLAVGNTGPVDEAADPERFEKARQERLEVASELARRVARQSDPLVTVGLALLTPTSGKDSRLLSEVDFGRSLGVQMSVHQNRPGDISLLDREGRLGPDLVVVHSNTASSEEVDMLVASGSVLSSTPKSEVGAGWSPRIMRRALRRGLRMGIGIDTPSTESVSLWEQIRVLMLLMNALDAEEARGLGRYPIDPTLGSATLSFEGALQAATRGGAHALCVNEPDMGTLTPGAYADLIVVRPNDPDVAFDDPASYLVQYGSPDQVETVVADGVVRKKDFVLVGVQMDDLAATNTAVRKRVFGVVEE